MRSIGTISTREHSESFSNILLANGIDNSLEQVEDSDVFSVWVLSEDQLEDAVHLLKQFRENPKSDEFNQIARKGESIRQREKITRQKAQVKAELAEVSMKSSLSGYVTNTLMGISILVFLLMQTGNNQITSYLFLSNYQPINGAHWWQALIEIRSGQIWRIITPAFLHFSVMHILFNMLWLNDLGRMLENRKGSLFLLLFFLVTAAISNVAQFAVAPGVPFGGMSGVVYGLLGYVWMKSRFAPHEGFYLHPYTVIMMVIWLALGFSGIIGNMANVVHATGLMTGMIWGYLASTLPKRSK